MLRTCNYLKLNVLRFVVGGVSVEITLTQICNYAATTTSIVFTIQINFWFRQKAVSAGLVLFKLIVLTRSLSSVRIDIFDNLELIYTIKVLLVKSWNVSVMLGLKYLRNLLGQSTGFSIILLEGIRGLLV